MIKFALLIVFYGANGGGGISSPDPTLTYETHEACDIAGAASKENYKGTWGTNITWTCVPVESPR